MAHKGLGPQAQTSTQQPTGLGPHPTKAPHTERTEGSAKIASLTPHKETSEKKGAEVFVEHEPDSLDAEFFSRLKHLSMSATRRRFAKP